MPKTKTQFVCQDCGYESSQWMGKCPECGNWNTLKEFKTQTSKKTGKGVSQYAPTDITPKKLQEIISTEKSRIKTEFSEMDTVLGGGIVLGSVILLAGDPGIGKSTLLLQTCLHISKTKKVLYVSGEESVEQIKMRATRITGEIQNDNLLLLTLSDTDAIAQLIGEVKPELVIIDSIQTMQSENLEGMSGAVGQIRYATATFISTAKSLHIPIILVGHVTKEGMVAGPMVLSHMVDTVLFLEGEKFTSTRILRSLKNRFGPVDEVGIFVMQGEGMTEVKNPEQIFLTQKTENVPGSAFVVILEGTRPFLIEIQALVVYSKLPMPRRVAAGIDHRRLELLLAVLQKHCRLPVETMDVFVNIAGGVKVEERGADLAICLAIYSSLKNKALSKMVGIAEVGLLGELRNVSSIEKRVKEAQKLGFTDIITATNNNALAAVLQNLERKPTPTLPYQGGSKE